MMVFVILLALVFPVLAAPSQKEAEAAVRTLILWAGDNPDREGLVETPQRVAKAFGEFFSGYQEDPREILSKTFEEVGSYDGVVTLKDIPFVSHCEHHMVPIIGKAHISYKPNKRVVGISKLARIVDLYAKRLQTQERLTAQIADAIEDVLKPLGIHVQIEANHQCMSTRGVNKPDVIMVTSKGAGCLKHGQP